MELFGWKIFKEKQLDTVFFNRNAIFDKLLPKCEKIVIFDVGANVGQSLEEFKSKLPNSEIHCFEPESSNFEQLEANSAKYSDCKIVKAGVGSEKGILKINKYDQSCLNSFLAIDENSLTIKACSHPKVNASLQKNIEKEDCLVITLDDYCREMNISKINLLKIDVQGFENQVLKGAKEILEGGVVDLILVEIIFDDCYGVGNTFFNVESFLVPNGYILYDIFHIYKDIRIGRTNWVDAVYIKKDTLKLLLDDKL